LPTHFPDGAKYVIEGRGHLVHRHIEFPDGRWIDLPPRKAQTCACIEQRKIAGKAGKPARTSAKRSVRRAA
jgi:hypothetical protein